MTTWQQIAPDLADVRAELTDVLAEALFAILLQSGQLTTGSAPNPPPANNNAQHLDNERL